MISASPRPTPSGNTDRDVRALMTWVQNVLEQTPVAVSTGGTVTPVNLRLNQVPSGSVDGSNQAFTVSQAYVAGTLALYLNGLRQKLGTDYAGTSGTTFTMSDAPHAGDILVIDYLTPTP